MSFFDRFKRAETKNISIAYMDEFLRWTMNHKLGQGAGDVSELRRSVPWLFRSIDTIAQKTADFPFEIQNDAGDVVDSSDDWQNALGFTKDFKRLLFCLSGSLNLHGQAYCYPARNRIAVKELRYWVAQSITPILTDVNGLEEFERRAGTITTHVKPDELLYWWLPDPDIELGPPLAYPAQAALNASGVLFSLDQFFGKHTRKGLVRAFLAAVKGMAPIGSEQGKAQKQKVESELNDQLGGADNFGTIRVINADSLTIVPVGEGLKELENVALTDEKRADIAVAMNMPATYIWSGDASGIGGGGVSKEDTYRLMANNIVPGFNFIADVLNEQLLIPLGYKLVGLPETLDVFQEDEVSRSSALSSLTTAINTDPSTAKFSMSILGYELDDEQAAQLDELIAGKELQREQAAQAAEQAKQDVMQPGQQTQDQDAEQVVKKSIEAGQFKRFAEKHPDKVSDFVFHFLDADEQKSLKGAQSSDTGRPFRTEEYRERLATLRGTPDPTSQ